MFWNMPIGEGTLSRNGRNCDSRFEPRKLLPVFAQFVAATGEFPLFVAESILPLGHSSFVAHQLGSQCAANVSFFEHRLPLSFKFRQL